MQTKRQDFSNQIIMNEDFSNQRFTRSTLTNATFHNCNLTNADFEHSIGIEAANLVGSFWGGKVLEKNPLVVNLDNYFLMLTDTWMQINCYQMSVEDWFSKDDIFRFDLGSQSGKTTEDKQTKGQAAIDWWDLNKIKIQDLIEQYKKT